MPSQGPFTITAFIKRHPDLTEEQFYHHWETKHAPLVSPWCLKHGVIEYRQLHTPPHLRSQWASINGRDSFGFDGLAAMTFESFDCFVAAFSDPYYINVIEIDERRFLDKTKSISPTSTMGLTKTVIQGGDVKVDVGPDVMVEWKRWEEGNAKPEYGEGVSA